MLDNLTDKLSGLFHSLSGRGKISEENVREAMKEVRTALLEADVSFKVVREFTDNVVQKAIGREVIKSLKPSELMVQIIYEEHYLLLLSQPHHHLSQCCKRSSSQLLRIRYFEHLLLRSCHCRYMLQDWKQPSQRLHINRYQLFCFCCWKALQILAQQVYEAVEGCLMVEIEPDSIGADDRVLELAV